MVVSSAEPELHGVAKATSEALRFRSVLRDLGTDVANRPYSDAIAVPGIIQGQGLEKPWLVGCNYIFVEAPNTHIVYQFSAVLGNASPADIGTKDLPWEAMLKQVTLAGGIFADRRPELCRRVS